MLRSASKSIMLWDPDGPARKPPREAADLLLSVEELFDLSDRMQRSTNPDYLSLTIGNTTREAVEKAYEWILPIIATMPETIARLQSSTSCFLLLRAYGAEGEERKQLEELSAPLLHHVQESLKGHFGVDDTVKAFDLLMSDIASPNPGRRRCARRVLRDALRTPNGSTDCSGGWMANITRLKHANSLVTSAVEHMVSKIAASSLECVIVDRILNLMKVTISRPNPQLLNEGECFDQWFWLSSTSSDLRRKEKLK